MGDLVGSTVLSSGHRGETDWSLRDFQTIICRVKLADVLVFSMGFNMHSSRFCGVVVLASWLGAVLGVTGWSSLCVAGQQPRVGRAVDMSVLVGGTNFMVVEMDAQGNENAVGFSLNYNSAALRFVEARLGSGSTVAAFLLNTNLTGSGRVGFALSQNFNQTFPAGTRSLVEVGFTPVSASAGINAVTFGNSPIAQEISDVLAQLLSADYRGGNVTIIVPNRAPTLDPINPVTMNEDGGVQTVNLTGITAGPGETHQVLTVSTSTTNSQLITNLVVTYASPSTTGVLTFAPVTNASGGATITVVVGDDGGTADGGIDAVTNSFTVTVSAVNDAPVLTQNTPSLGTTTEDGTTAAKLISSFVLSGTGTANVATGLADVDTGAVQGIAVTGKTGNGTWEYSADGATGWTPFGTVSVSGALLLPDSYSIRYVPDQQNAEVATITYYGWDRSTGTAGTTVDLSGGGATGTTTAYSVLTDTASLSVTPVNDAPVLSQIPNLSLNEEGALHLNNAAAELTQYVTDPDSSSFEFRIVNAASLNAGFGLSIGMAGTDFAVRSDNSIHAHPAANFN